MSAAFDPPFWAAPALLAAALAALGFVAKTVADLLLRLRDAALKRRSRLTELLALLRAGDVAFASQQDLCKRLAELIRTRDPAARKIRGYDRLFSASFESMTAQERDLHRLIRNITTHTLHPLNQELLIWLRADDYYRAISPTHGTLGPLALFLIQLEAHLVLWGGKYEAWIPGNAAHALVFLADEERHGVGFPKHGVRTVAAVLQHPGAGGKDISDRKPKGSGYFAAVAGLAFLAAFLLIAFYDDSRTILDFKTVLGVWLAIVSGILLVWGVNRIVKGRQDRTVGQSTINFVVGLIAVTIALIALLLDAKP